MTAVFFVSQVLVFAGLFLLRPASGKETGKAAAAEKKEETGPPKSIWQPGLLTLFIGMLLCYLSFTAITVFQVNILESVGGGSRELGISTFIASIAELPVMALFVPLSRRFSYRSLLRLSCAFFLVRVVLMLAVSSVYAVYAVQTLTMLSHGLFIPASAYYINSIIDPSANAAGQAYLGIFTYGLSGLISNLVSGIILDHFSVRSLLLLMVCLAVIGLCMVCWALERIRRNRG